MGDEMVPMETIENKILLIRGQKVLIDRDLAELFNVETKYLNRQVKRNIDRFPELFMFQLTENEKVDVVTNWHHLAYIKYSHQLPYAFTEHGVAMLATVLNSKRAIKMSINIIKAFIKLRQLMANNKEFSAKLEQLEKRVLKHDSDIRELVRDIRKLSFTKSTDVKRIGFLR